MSHTDQSIDSIGVASGAEERLPISPLMLSKFCPAAGQRNSWLMRVPERGSTGLPSAHPDRPPGLSPGPAPGRPPLRHPREPARRPGLDLAAPRRVYLSRPAVRFRVPAGASTVNHSSATARSRSARARAPCFSCLNPLCTLLVCTPVHPIRNWQSAAGHYRPCATPRSERPSHGQQAVTTVAVLEDLAAVGAGLLLVVNRAGAVRCSRWLGGVTPILWLGTSPGLGNFERHVLERERSRLCTRGHQEGELATQLSRTALQISNELLRRHK